MSHLPRSSPYNLTSLRRSAAALTLLSAVAIIALRLWCRTTALDLASEPPGASVWVDGKFAGVAPAALPALARGPHLVVVTKHGFKPWRHTIVANTRNQAVNVRLQPVQNAQVTILTTPPGATVLLDGTERGRTPLTMTRLAPGSYQLRLVRAGCLPLEQSIDVASDKPLTIEKKLVSQVEEFYHQRIQESPSNIFDLIELGHHYVLQNEFEQAEKALCRAGKLAAKSEWVDDSQRRLYQELDKIHSAQFDFGDDAMVRKAQAMVKRVYKAILATSPRDARARYCLGRALAQEGHKSDAKRELRRALRDTHDNGLRRRISRELRRL